GFNKGSGQGIVTCEGGAHGLGVLFPEPRAAFDVREEEGNRAGGQVEHPPPHRGLNARSKKRMITSAPGDGPIPPGRGVRPAIVTATPCGATSRRNPSQKATTPALVAPYTATPGIVTAPATEAIAMMWPRPAASIAGSTACTLRTTPSRLTSTCSRSCSSVVSTTGTAWPTPAYATRTSTQPNRSEVAAPIACTASGSRMSVGS